MARVVPGNGTQMLRGVFMLGSEDDVSGSATVYVETPHPGMTLTMDTPKVRFQRIATMTALHTCVTIAWSCWLHV